MGHFSGWNVSGEALSGEGDILPSYKTTGQTNHHRLIISAPNFDAIYNYILAMYVHIGPIALCGTPFWPKSCSLLKKLTPIGLKSKSTRDLRKARSTLATMSKQYCRSNRQLCCLLLRQCCRFGNKVERFFDIVAGVDRA